MSTENKQNPRVHSGSAKKLRCYNTKLVPIQGWDTEDKRKSIEVIDEKNGFAFCITFGKSPEIHVYKNSSEENFGDLVFKKTL